MEERGQTHGTGQARRQRRRSIALALLLGAVAILFYLITVVRGPGVLPS